MINNLDIINEIIKYFHKKVIFLLLHKLLNYLVKFFSKDDFNLDN